MHIAWVQLWYTNAIVHACVHVRRHCVTSEHLYCTAWFMLTNNVAVNGSSANTAISMSYTRTQISYSLINEEWANKHACEESLTICFRLNHYVIKYVFLVIYFYNYYSYRIRLYFREEPCVSRIADKWVHYILKFINSAIIYAICIYGQLAMKPLDQENCIT